MTKRDLKVKHLKALLKIANALNMETYDGKGGFELAGPDKAKPKNLTKGIIETIEAMERFEIESKDVIKKLRLTKTNPYIEENDRLAKDIEEKNFKIAVLETQIRSLGVNPEYLYQAYPNIKVFQGELKEHINKEVDIKFDMPGEVNLALNEVPGGFTPRTEKSEVEPAKFSKSEMALKIDIAKLEEGNQNLKKKLEELRAENDILRKDLAYAKNNFGKDRWDGFK